MYSLFKNITGIFLFLLIFSFTGTKIYANDVHTYRYDTTQPKTINLPAFQKDTTGKVKLLQKIVSALQFRRNARAREQQRVITIIRTVMADSMVATSADIKKLNAELSLQQNQHFDSLRALIDKIMSRPEPTPAPDDPAEEVIDTPVAPVSEADVTALINKIIPILQQKEAEERNSAAQQQRLQKVRELYGRDPDKIDTLPVNDSIGKTYTLQLGHKAAVIGIHPYWMSDKFLHYNYTTISEANYYGYTTAVNATRIPDSLQFFNLANNRTFTFYETDASRIEALLKDESSQLHCVDSLLLLLRQYQAEGVNVWLAALNGKQRTAFTHFIGLLHNNLNIANPQYRLTVTVPPFDEAAAYDLRALNSFTTHFLVDFTKAGGTAAGPLSPMKGDARRAIEPVISRLLNQQIPPAKFILLLSYYGTEWKKGADGRDLFTRYVSYSDIKKRFPSDTSVNYDEDAVAALIREKDAPGTVTSEIWFDDASTLDVKYDFILNMGLGGVAVWPLGADDGYGELWDVLTDKFVSIDTTFLATVPLVPQTEPTLSWWGRLVKKLRHEAHVLKLMFTDPCQLDIENRHGHNDDTFFVWLTVFLLITTLLIGFLYAYNLRMKGTSWKWRKMMLRILVGSVFVTAFFAIAAGFLNRDVPFGITPNMSAGARCVTIPMLDALLIFAAGICLGMLIMRLLIRPLLTHEDKP
ncbi:chitinase II [Chitinophaga pinensis DSM 2588]|uniref:Chitinase II n=1 Tax=Chitinophaga pinensis (strain ATCC 43595 / DSM 2588 / LMG 13176 / NBRC 15968 / NCIMB 11800 / UQM 2034) TaxID=485918 RepID=A0A979G5V8_CHIPD|nr:chitinase II [Chitinophaga pinensis DSM 2588]